MASAAERLAFRPRLSPYARRRLRRGERLLVYLEGILSLDAVGSALVDLADGTRTVPEIASIVRAFQRDPDGRLERDLEAFFCELGERGVLSPAPLPAASARSASAAHPPRPQSSDDEGPYTLIAELTYRCPMRCAYCSNPRTHREHTATLSAEDWCRVIDEAESLGVVHVHFTGGEPLLFAELEALVRRARARELYVTLITSGAPCGRGRLAALAKAGLDAVQLSFQALTIESALRIAGVDKSPQKHAVAAWTREIGLPLVVNVVLHRENIEDLESFVALAESLDAQRLELANAQYLGWALENRDTLLPSAEQIALARGRANRARARLRGRMQVVFVLPDYRAGRPRACMDGWARRTLLVAPDGIALPCHAARALPGIQWPSVLEESLAAIWSRSPGFNAFRGDRWMREPCRSCARRFEDFGGCRCQAFALTGDPANTDPACELSPHHAFVKDARSKAGLVSPGRLVHR